VSRPVRGSPGCKAVGCDFSAPTRSRNLDFNVVTRPFQNNNTQHWRLTKVGGNVHTIQQVRNRRFLDAHEISSLKFRVVTRPQQNNDTQRWRLLDFGGGFFQIQQLSNGPGSLRPPWTGTFRW
jgi:hypothetical protein